MIVAECFLICAFLGVRYVKQKASLLNIDTTWNAEEMTNSNISVAKEEMMKGYWTVALFGVDSRNNSVGQGNMADVIIICNVNQETGEIKLVSVPPVTGMDRSTAEAVLQQAGLTPSFEREDYNSEFPAGQVYEQSVPSGTQVKEGTTVTCRVSLGAEPAPEPEQPSDTGEDTSQGDGAWSNGETDPGAETGGQW